jgi:hypothetical protein
MRIVRFFLISAFLIVSWQTSKAQEEERILISTKPSGATIYLKGEFDIVANTPAHLPMDISGRYKAKITRPGYETWKGELTFVPGSANDVEVALSAKSRYKASLRSIFVPGWGQIYSGNSRRGSMFLSAAVISGISIFVTNRRYENKNNDYNIALADFNAASSIEEKNRLRTILSDERKEAYDAETDRNMAIAIGIATWAFNIIDALVFFPEGDAFFPTVTALSDGASFTFTSEF